MNAKKKLFISLASFALVLVFAVVTALALRTVSLTSKHYTVSFKATSVRATFTITTTYYQAMGGQVNAGYDSGVPAAVLLGSDSTTGEGFKAHEVTKTFTIDDAGAYIGNETASGAVVAGASEAVSGEGKSGYTVSDYDLLAGLEDFNANKLASNGYGRTGVLKFVFDVTTSSNTNIKYTFTSTFAAKNVGVIYLQTAGETTNANDPDFTGIFNNLGAPINTYATSADTTPGAEVRGSKTYTSEFNSKSTEANAPTHFTVIAYVFVINPAYDIGYTAGQTNPFVLTAELA